MAPWSGLWALGRGCPGLCPVGPIGAMGWEGEGTGPSVPRTCTASRVTRRSPGGGGAGRRDRGRMWSRRETAPPRGQVGAPPTQTPRGAPAAYQALDQALRSFLLLCEHSAQVIHGHLRTQTIWRRQSSLNPTTQGSTAGCGYTAEAQWLLGTPRCE